jgi:molecular chaperone GrpE
MAVNGIDPHHPLRPAIPEEDALQRIFKEVRNAVRAADCTRAVLVGHNAFFDLNFLNAAVLRTQIKRNPFHPFTSFDTATLGGVAFGQTVLMRATLAAGLEWDTSSAHSAAYDAERTADLQRVTAEYANYRKRVERDRAAVREQAVANVLSGLVPVLDDIGRAREHEELVGGFKSVAESLEAAVTKLGLESFGEDGEPFDPKVHEALMHSYSPDVTEPTCIKILQPGYRVGERILRPARVEVAEPGEAEAPDEPDGPLEAAGSGGAHHQASGSGDAPGRQETSADDE